MAKKQGILFLLLAIGFLFFSYKAVSNQNQTFHPVEDAFVRGGSHSNENYHNHEDGLFVKQGSVNTFFRKAFVKFDLTAYDLEKVGNAKLRLYCYRIEKPGELAHLNAYEVSNAWEEATITWETSPVFISNLGMAPVVLDAYLEIDVTEYIARAINEAYTEVSFGLFDGNASNNGLYFHNKNGDNPPQLVIDEEEIIPPALLTDTYYIDAEQGNDENDGLTEETAWQTLEHINSLQFGPGAQLLFKSGQNWFGSLQPAGTGEEGNLFVIGKFGDGPRPAIHGGGVLATIHLRNVEYTLLRDLEVTNYDASEEGGKTLEEWETWNVTDWLEADNPPQYISGNSRKIGVLVTATDMGEVNHIHLINLHVHGVNGAIDDNVEATKDNGGIAIEITGVLTPTWFNDLRVEDCHIHDVDRTGLYNSSSWSTRTLTENTTWTPTLNFVIRNNVFERSGANALILRVAENPIVEHNLFCTNAIKGSGNAAFNFNTDGALWQFNESRFTKKNQGDHDAGGIDSDFRSKNTIIQYNYIHDNDYGMLVTGGRSDWGAFNDNTIVRYNIFERDGSLPDGDGHRFTFKISGNASNTYVHNNVFYLSPEQTGVNLMFHKNWGGFPDHSYYFNNIYYLEGTNHSSRLTSSTNNHFFNNLYHGHPSVSWPPNPINSVAGDPLFHAVGEGPEGYRINEGSPAINKGVAFEQVMMPNVDYFGNTIPETDFIDIGAHQLSLGGNVSIGSLVESPDTGSLNIYPIPVTDNLNVSIARVNAENIRMSIASINGASVFLGEERLSNGAGNFEFDLNQRNLKPGMYTLLVQADSFIISRKFIYSGRKQ